MDDTLTDRQCRIVAGYSSDVFYQTDTSGLIEWITPNVTTVLGYTPASLVGTPARQLVHPDDLGLVNQRRAEVYGGREFDQMIETRMRTSSGAYRTMSIRARPIRDADRTVVGAIVAARDTHESSATVRALTTLSMANRVLVRATNETTLLHSTCQTICDAGHYALAWYGRAMDDREKSVLPIAYSEGSANYVHQIKVSWDDSPNGQGPTGTSIRTRETQVRNNVAADHRYSPWVNQATEHGFVSSISLPVIIDGKVDGALMVYAREAGAFHAAAQSLLEDLAADLGYGIERLRDGLRLQLALRNSITMLSAAVEARDPYTAGHQWQVASLAAEIGRELGMSEDQVEGLVLGAAVHDLGKIAVPQAILNKPGRPTEQEWAILRSHPQVGKDIAGEFPWPWPIGEMIFQHHERLNGSGYPLGLTGEDILLEARIIAVADTVDAIAHDRPYRKAPGAAKAIAVIDEGRGTLFDPDVVDAFHRVLDSGYPLAQAER